MAEVVKVGPFGGSGDGIFDTGKFCQLKKIRIRYGRLIDSMLITYLVNGRIENCKVGGEGGETDAQVEIKPGEFLIRISGTYGPVGNNVVVRSLTFYSNLNKYGPYGVEEGDAFDVPVLNGKIVGFFGCSGAYLEAVGINIVPTCCYGPKN